MSLKSWLILAGVIVLAAVAGAIAARLLRWNRKRQRAREKALKAQSEWTDAVDSRLHR